MEKFEVNILGCGSALPTVRHNPSCQVVNFRDKLFMVDCGEGTQKEMRRQRLNFSRLQCVFLSHLHGDHCLGLVGLISSMSLMERKQPLDVFGPQGLREWLEHQINFFGRGLSFEVNIHEIDHQTSEKVYESKSLSVFSIPLSHSMPACGYLFKEEQPLPSIIREMIDFYHVPNHAIRSIKEGNDWTTPDGEVVSYKRFVRPPRSPRSFAYMSDTKFLPQNAPLIQGIDLLYHEATFLDRDKDRAHEILHTTAHEAAQMAIEAKAGRLVIGHFSTRYDNEEELLQEAQEIFPDTILANEGLCVKI